MSHPSPQTPVSWSPVLVCLLATAMSQVGCYYTTSLAAQKVDPLRVARAASLSSLLAALALAGLSWNLRPPEDHGLSAGVIIGAVLLVSATVMLTHPAQLSQTSLLVGYSTTGLPLYASQRAPPSALAGLGPALTQVLENNDSRRIFYFLLLNLVTTSPLPLPPSIPHSLPSLPLFLPPSFPPPLPPSLFSSFSPSPTPSLPHSLPPSLRLSPVWSWPTVSGRTAWGSSQTASTCCLTALRCAWGCGPLS